MKRNVKLLDFPASLWEHDDFEIFNRKTEHWPASWVLEIARDIQRLGDGRYAEAWKVALDALREAECAAEDDLDSVWYESSDYCFDVVQDHLIEFLIRGENETV